MLKITKLGKELETELPNLKLITNENLYQFIYTVN